MMHQDPIASLVELDSRIPTLLSLLSSALEALLPPPPDQPEIEEGERFLEAARAYYELLDDIQLQLRTSIHHLRLSHSLPLLADFIPSSSGASGSKTGLKERMVELEALEERTWALEQLAASKREQASSLVDQEEVPSLPAGDEDAKRGTEGQSSVKEEAGDVEMDVP